MASKTDKERMRRGVCIRCETPVPVGKQVCRECRKKDTVKRRMWYRLRNGIPLDKPAQQTNYREPPPVCVEGLNIPYPSQEEELAMGKVIRERAASIRRNWGPLEKAGRMELYPYRRPL